MVYFNMIIDIFTVVVVCLVIAVLERIFRYKRTKFSLSTVGLIAILLPPATALRHPVDTWVLVAFSLIGAILLMKETRS